MCTRARLLLATLSMPLLSACPTGMCDTSIVPSIVVEIRDAESGAPAATGATAVAVSVSDRITLEPYGMDQEGDLVSLATPGERPGDFTVRVTKTGYAEWEREGVRIPERDCHTNQAVLDARLEEDP